MHRERKLKNSNNTKSTPRNSNFVILLNQIHNAGENWSKVDYVPVLRYGDQCGPSFTRFVLSHCLFALYTHCFFLFHCVSFSRWFTQFIYPLSPPAYHFFFSNNFLSPSLPFSFIFPSLTFGAKTFSNSIKFALCLSYAIRYRRKFTIVLIETLAVIQHTSLSVSCKWLV